MKQQPILVQTMAYIIPLIILLITKFNYIIFTSHQLSIKKFAFRALSIVVVGMVLVGLYLYKSDEHENLKMESINASRF